MSVIKYSSLEKKKKTPILVKILNNCCYYWVINQHLYYLYFNKTIFYIEVDSVAPLKHRLYMCPFSSFQLQSFRLTQGSFRCISCLQCLWYYMFHHLNSRFKVNNDGTGIVKSKKKNISHFNSVVVFDQLEFSFVLKI